jgi:hypothetical protein
MLWCNVSVWLVSYGFSDVILISYRYEVKRRECLLEIVGTTDVMSSIEISHNENIIGNIMCVT